jgi:hypothetical protein
LDYVVRAEVAVKPEEEVPLENYETVDQEMTARAPHNGRPFVNDRHKVWYIMLMIVQSLGWLRFYSHLQNLLFY